MRAKRYVNALHTSARLILTTFILSIEDDT